MESAILSDGALHSQSWGGHWLGSQFLTDGNHEIICSNQFPYKGTPAAIPDVLAGRTPLYIALTAELIEQHRGGAIRLLATADVARSPFLPDVPTLRESGIAIDAPGWFAFYAPARTPGDVVAHLENAIIAAMQAADTRSKIVGMGYEPTGTTSEALRRIQRSDFVRWRDIVKASGFKAEQ